MENIIQRMVMEMKLRNMSDRTVDVYTYRVRCFLMHFQKAPENIRDDEIGQYLMFLRETKNYSWSGVNIVYSAIKFLYEQTLGVVINHFPMPRPTREKRLPVVLSISEVKRLLTHEPNAKYRLIFMMIYATGMRLNELLHVRQRDIDRERMLILVRYAKGGRARYVPMNATLLIHIENYLRTQPKQRWLFPGQIGDEPLADRYVQGLFRTLQKRSRLSKQLNVHALRHSLATHLYENGTDLMTIQRVLGHRSINPTLQYIQLQAREFNQIDHPLDHMQAFTALPKRLSRSAYADRRYRPWRRKINCFQESY